MYILYSLVFVAVYAELLEAFSHMEASHRGIDVAIDSLFVSKHSWTSP